MTISSVPVLRFVVIVIAATITKLRWIRTRRNSPQDVPVDHDIPPKMPRLLDRAHGLAGAKGISRFPTAHAAAAAVAPRVRTRVGPTEAAARPGTGSSVVASMVSTELLKQTGRRTLDAQRSPRRRTCAAATAEAVAVVMVSVGSLVLVAAVVGLRKSRHVRQHRAGSAATLLLGRAGLLNRCLGVELLRG